ncbi:MAG: hypothetical protein ACLQO6_13620 [Desulfomonilaceae bacterium]
MKGPPSGLKRVADVEDPKRACRLLIKGRSKSLVSCPEAVFSCGFGVSP